MNFSELKNLVKKLGGAVVMKDERPEFVILSYENYKKISQENGAENSPKSADFGGENEALEKLNKEISALKEEIRQREELELLDQDEQEPNAQNENS